MFEPNEREVLRRIRPEDRVLDVGGWARPFNRADVVVDAEPYETRGYYRREGGAGAQGGSVERFTRETWIQMDVCGPRPLPFPDRHFDFAVCSHTLEDVRDPLFLCAELIRVAKAGYIEVPSRAAESSRGCEHPAIAGYSHHRWLIDIDGSVVTFMMKYHLIQADWRYSLPQEFLWALSDSRRVQWLFWEDRFEFRERVIHGAAQQIAELERFVRVTHPYPAWQLAASDAARAALALPRRAARRLFRAAGGR